jgi:hypothetical protein
MTIIAKMNKRLHEEFGAEIKLGFELHESL